MKRILVVRGKKMDTSYAKRLDLIKERVEKAKGRAGREGEEVIILPITKNRSITQIQGINQLGLQVVGENRVQEMMEKYPSLGGASWHMVGHLQRNKVKYLVRLKRCVMVQSLDSRRLIQRLQEELKKEDRTMDALLQINIASDPNKYGFTQEDLPSLLEEVQDYQLVKIKGLMTIVPYVGDPEEVRPYFRKLFTLFQRIREEGPPWVQMQYLSMGMTNDFEIAVEEGANMIRIGSALFESLIEDRGGEGD